MLVTKDGLARNAPTPVKDAFDPAGPKTQSDAACVAKTLLPDTFRTAPLRRQPIRTTADPHGRRGRCLLHDAHPGEDESAESGEFAIGGFE